MKDKTADIMPELANYERAMVTQSESKKIRGSTEICAAILETCSDGAIRTHVMYKANLSHAMLGEYSRLLLECGLLQSGKRDSKVVFWTTEKGRQYLLHYQCMQQLTKRAEKKLGHFKN